MRRSLYNFIFIIFSFLVSTNLYAEINLINPIEGNWANKQMLILDAASLDAEYFYSVDGSNPEEFGFAYDGPVFLDVSGDVTLKITKIVSHKEKETLELKYSVNENNGSTTSYHEFISSFFESGIFNYTSGSDFIIPSELKFSFEFLSQNFIQGQTLKISEKSNLTRSFPCTILDPLTNEKWRFIIKTYPLASGIFTRRDLPIRIQDWETLEFLDENLIYKIDSEYWELPKKPIKLDRNVSHMISWQSINYEYGNPIEAFVLPPKPELKTSQSENGEFICTLQGDESYKMSILSEENSYQELFSEICADVFYGDKYSGNLEIGIFCSGLFQGKIDVPYSLNKRPSAPPSIISDTQNFYTRKDVNIKIESEVDSELFYAISEPFSLSNFSYKLEPSAPELKNISADNFVKSPANSISFSLSGLKESSVFYKIRAYSQKDSNQSEITEYCVIIDQSNFYYDSSNVSDFSDGTIEHPFSDFESLLSAVNLSRNVKIFIKGDLLIPSGKYELFSNCVIVGNDDSNIIFDEDSQLIVNDSSLDFQKIVIKNKKDTKSTKMIPLIKGNRSVLSFSDCLIYAEFEKNGTVIDSYNSVVYFDDSICATISNSYTCFITGIGSKIFIKKSNISASSQTSVLLSFSDSQINCSENTFSVNCKRGRIAECFNTEGSFEKNEFKGELSNIKNTTNPIFADEKSVISVKDNANYGF